MPALREGYMDGETEWAVLLVRPGKEPYENLARAVIRATAQDRTDAPPSVKTLAEQIRRSDRGLARSCWRSSFRRSGGCWSSSTSSKSCSAFAS